MGSDQIYKNHTSRQPGRIKVPVPGRPRSLRFIGQKPFCEYGTVSLGSGYTISITSGSLPLLSQELTKLSCDRLPWLEVVHTNASRKMVSHSDSEEIVSAFLHPIINEVKAGCIRFRTLFSAGHELGDFASALKSYNDGHPGSPIPFNDALVREIVGMPGGDSISIPFKKTTYFVEASDERCTLTVYADSEYRDAAELFWHGVGNILQRVSSYLSLGELEELPKHMDELKAVISHIKEASPGKQQTAQSALLRSFLGRSGAFTPSNPSENVPDVEAIPAFAD